MSNKEKKNELEKVIGNNEVDSNPYDMEMIQDFIKNRVEASPVDFSKENPKERLKVINTLFKIFISVYGRQFIDQYDNDFSRDIWFNALLEFTKEDIAGGIEAVLKDEYVTAPNLKKFIICCRNYKKVKTNRLPTLVKGKNNY